MKKLAMTLMILLLMIACASVSDDTLHETSKKVPCSRLGIIALPDGIIDKRLENEIIDYTITYLKFCKPELDLFKLADKND